ncbi:hypothetical protein GOBAR_AA24789 [Gossypium barbadense]|uniref:SANT domain-containing protein n=1 Tax=Gossypium barbadense TaxID=3634 RepID=A0A2P5WXP2_GOSBA|nr:hypothetical protein GOBAR_AA24789 [Gossypium barbadense]
MHMEIIQVDPNCNLTEETSPKQLLPPDSPDISDIFGDSQLSPRVGNRYQAEIPPMIAGWEHLQLLMNSEGSPYIDHSFMFSLAVPVTWIHEQDIDFEDEGKEGPSKPDDATKVARKCRKGQNSKRKKNSELSAERSNARLVDEKESNAENLECGMAPCGGKSSHLIPGSSSDAWNNTEADSFLLGLYIFGKDFGKIKQLIGNKKMGDILSFYYGAFYKSDRYRRWSSGQKRRNRRIICGRKIFTGWRQQKLLSRLLTHVQDELQNNFLEVNANHTKARHCEGITASSTARHTKFSVVDTSLLHGGKSSQVRELRYLPVKFDISSKIKVCSGGNEDNSSDDSSDEREQRITDGLSSHGSVVMDMKPGSKPVTADNQNPKNSCMADQGFLTHQYERTNASEDTRSNTIIKHHFSRRAKSSHSPCLVPSGKKITAPAISLASPMKGERLTAPAKTQRRHRTENISSNPIHSVSPVKRQRFNACGKIEESCFSEKFPADIHEQTELCCALKSQDDGSIEVLRVSDSEEKVSSIGSSAEGNPQSIETLQGSSEKLPLLSSDGSNPPLLPLDARNGEPGMLETDGSQLAIENNYADLSKTDATVCAEDEQPMTSSRRQSKRIRPLTSKVLEALESGFLNMKRMKKVRDAQAEAMRLSSPSLKALSTVDATSKRESASDKTVEGGASICSKDVTNEPPQMAH